MSLLALTSYYNPLHGSLRRLNYHTFRRHLGIPLMTVEWSKNGNFELGMQDADHLIQVSGGDLLWQKERLLNIGLGKAREMGFDKVAVLDSDIVFEDPEWHELVSKALDTRDFIQCFQTAHYLPLCEHQNISRQALCNIPGQHFLPSLFSFLLKGESIYQEEVNIHFSNATKLRGNPGMATAIHVGRAQHWSHYEGNIVGGADLAMIAAICQKTCELFATADYTPQHQKHLLQWGETQGVSNTRIGNTGGRIMHLWHGDIRDRQYRERYSILTRHQYNPATDVDSNTGGALRFVPESPTLQRAVGDYIRSRKDA